MMESPDRDFQKQQGFLCGVVEGTYLPTDKYENAMSKKNRCSTGSTLNKNK